MPTKLIAVVANNMDTSKPDRNQAEAAGEEETKKVEFEETSSLDLDEFNRKEEDNLERNDDNICEEHHENNGKDIIHKDIKEDCVAEEIETPVDTTSDIDATCDIDDVDYPGSVTHVVVDTVIVRDTDTVSFRNQDSPKDDDDENESQVHINVQTVPARNEFNNSPVNGSTDSKRNRNSGKSSKKDKPSPFKKKDSLPTKEILNPNSPTPLSTERCDSSLSTTSGDVCRICQCDRCEIQYDSPLVSPCLCAGSLKYIHQACLQKWIKSSDKLSCELCQFEYSMTKKTKPFREWERLDMTPAERRKVICSVTFHIIAITCVVWSLYVLIDRTTEEVEAGTLLWPFWTKLIVVAIGFTGGVVFMYVQCKMYLTLCKKWRMYNKVIIISSISESQREKANQQGVLRLNEKQAQLEEERPNLNVFNIVNETESV